MSVIGVSGRHVHVVDEPDQLKLAHWGEGFSSLLLEHLLQVHLEQVGVGVEVEVDNLLEVFIAISAHLCQQTLDDLGFATSGDSD